MVIQTLDYQDPKLKNLKLAIAHYDMPIFAVDLLKDFYHTTNPFKISNLLVEFFDLELKIEEILILIAHDDEPRQVGKDKISFKQLFA